jgi:type II secretory pathway pseudopilin PulG
MTSRSPKRPSEQGYILLMLMLFITLLAIGAAAIAPSIAFQVKRDREEEMIHRGVQYSRAIRRYVKKFGRYPTRIEELENTNNLRFLRRKYKDPITGQDFKILHMGDVKLTFGAGIAGAMPVGGSVPGVPTLGGAANFGAAQKVVATAGITAAANAGLQNISQPESTDNSGQGAATSGDAQAKSDKSEPQTEAASKSPFSGPVFGGGPIVGVASTSKDKTIREFNKKNHYDQWQFIYDPASDRGGLLNTPAQPPLQGAIGMGNQQQGMPGQPVTNPGMNPGGFNLGNQPVAPTPTQPPPESQQQ